MPVDTYTFQGPQSAQSAETAETKPGYYERPDFEQRYQKPLTDGDIEQSLISDEERRTNEARILLDEKYEAFGSQPEYLNDQSTVSSDHETIAQTDETQQEVNYHEIFKERTTLQNTKFIMDTGHYLEAIRRQQGEEASI